MNYLEKYRKERRLPLHIGLIRGGIGKEFVVKHYKKRKVITKFPDMSRVIASKGQRKCRDLFKEAVAFAKDAIADPEKKAKWQQRLKIRNDQVFNRVIRLYMKTVKEGLRVQVELRYETLHADGWISIKGRTYWVKVSLREYGKMAELGKDVDIGMTG